MYFTHVELLFLLVGIHKTNCILPQRSLGDWERNTDFVLGIPLYTQAIVLSRYIRTRPEM